MTAFDRITAACAHFAGRPGMIVICLALASLGVAAYLTGSEVDAPNLAISIVTLMLLPVLQASQNRDSAAVQAKLDELIKAAADARDDLIGVEEQGEAEITRLRL